MSIENIKKLEVGVDMAAFGIGIPDNASREERKKYIINGMENAEIALSSGDFDVLEKTFDYFIAEDPDNGLGNGVCESLDNDIWIYFSSEQITKAFGIKYNQLLDKNMRRACTTAIGIVNTENFEELRKIFNYNKHANSEKLVVDLEKWVNDEYKEQIGLLREDMKAW